MKQAISSIVVILGLAAGLFLTGCDNGPPIDDWTLPGSQGTTLVCLGNSLTAGFGATTPGEDDESKSYPAYLQAKVTIPVINAGVSGDTTSQALSRLNTDVLSKDPRIVIIELGANDLFNGIIPATTQNNLQKIIDRLNNGRRKIYLAKFYTDEIVRAMANEIGITDSALQTALINQYNAMFDKLASSKNVVLIDDIWDGVWGIHMSDPIHPDAAGYAIMADNYFKALQPYLQEHELLK
jgi:acyl-CoA thioesterase-1